MNFTMYDGNRATAAHDLEQGLCTAEEANQLMAEAWQDKIEHRETVRSQYYTDPETYDFENDSEFGLRRKKRTGNDDKPDEGKNDRKIR